MKMRIRGIPLLLIMMTSCLILQAQRNLLLNGDFESVVNGRIEHWDPRSQLSGNYSLDNKIKHTGRFSLRIGGVKTYDYLVTSGGKISDFQEDLIIRGWAKYENLCNHMVQGNMQLLPFVGIWTNNSDGSNNITFKAIDLQPGSRDWFKFEKIIHAEEVQGKIRMLHHNCRPVKWSFRINVARQLGTLWLDNLELIPLASDHPFIASLNSQEFLSATNAIISIRTNERYLFDSKLKPILRLVITNKKGSIIKQWKLKIKSKMMTDNIDISNLDPGNYVLSISSLSPPHNHHVRLPFEKLEDIFDQ